jgi:hypothetical protein
MLTYIWRNVMKKFSLVFIFFILAVGAVSSQEKAANARNNWISANFIFFYDIALNFPDALNSLGFGGSIKYERMLNPYISLGVNVYERVIFGPTFVPAPGIDAFFHYYPWGKTFFLGIALGYGGTIVRFRRYSEYYNEYIEEYSLSRTGIGVSPEIGWKIDLGNAGGFYLQTGVSTGFFFFLNGDLLKCLPQAYLGMGFAF